MKTVVSMPHHEYHARVRDFVEEKLKHLAKYYDRIVSIRALLERHAEEHRVELVAHVGHGVTLVVDARGGALTATVDEAIERMHGVLTRHKSRLEARRRRRR